jgi:hypothetical protein
LELITPSEPVCFTEFPDGLMRPVFEDTRGQYVIDDDGKSVRGTWFIPRQECDLAVIVKGRS